jgi:uncharacterized protein (DUF2342 family)
MLATAAAAAVTMVAVTGGAGASASAASGSAEKGAVVLAAGSKPGKPKPGGDQDAVLRKIAASLHVSVAKLENALRDVKRTSVKLGVEPTDPRVVAVFAKDLGISNARALQVLKEFMDQPGPGKPGKGDDQDALLRKIAASLHVSLATLENALRDMKITSGRLGVEPTDPRVVAVFAKDLKISSAEARKIIDEIVGQPGPPKPGKTPPGKTPPGKTPPGKTPPGKTPPGKTPPGKTPPGKTPPSKTPAPAPSGKA